MAPSDELLALAEAGVAALRSRGGRGGFDRGLARDCLGSTDPLSLGWDARCGRPRDSITRGAPVMHGGNESFRSWKGTALFHGPTPVEEVLELAQGATVPTSNCSQRPGSSSRQCVAPSTRRVRWQPLDTRVRKQLGADLLSSRRRDDCMGGRDARRRPFRGREQRQAQLRTPRTARRQRCPVTRERPACRIALSNSAVSTRRGAGRRPPRN